MTIRIYKKGYSLVEFVIYITIIAIIAFTVTSTLLSFSKSYRTILALRYSEFSGTTAMERLTRDLRMAVSVDTLNSTLGSSPGVLTIVSSATTTKFYVQNGVLKVNINGLYFGPLTLSNVTVTNLVFNLLNNGTSEAIKVDMSLQSTVGPVVRNKTYHSTIVLKGK